MNGLDGGHGVNRVHGAGASGATLAPRPTASSLVGVYRPAEPLFVRGCGAQLVDDTGRTYLDFTSGIAVNALGHGSPLIADAIRAAMETGLVHTSNLYRTRPAAELADWLVEQSFADAVFFSNSGAEANEAALKFARRRGRAVGGAAKTEVIALRGGFHGRTMGALSMTDRQAYREPFAPLIPGVHVVDATVEAVAAAAHPSRTAAVILEPIQGEGGVRVLPPSLLRGLRSLCDEVNALLIVDEVQVGLGRTGRLWAHEASGVVPDVMTLAKPLAGGLPMGATLVTAEVAAAIQPGDHGSTFGGGPLVASVALAVCRHIAQPEFLAGVRERSALIEARLDRWLDEGRVADARGAGLIRGVQLADAAPSDVVPIRPAAAPAPAAAVVARALEAGLLVCGAGPDVVRLLPPLTIDRDELLTGLDLLEESLGC